MSEGKFEPSKYLTKLQGKEYLEVKWRLLWLRTEAGNAKIDTELVRLEPDFALFKATIEVPGKGSATGYGSETAKDFRDFIEKAETKAIGRALAALGYGTQFCEDHDFGAGTTATEPKVVDSPVARPQPTPAQPQAQPQQRPAQSGDGITEPQRKKIFAEAERIGLDDEQLHEVVNADYHCGVSGLTKWQASKLIDWMLKQ